jgi:hypothetical protein
MSQLVRIPVARPAGACLGHARICPAPSTAAANGIKNTGPTIADGIGDKAEEGVSRGGEELRQTCPPERKRR